MDAGSLNPSHNIEKSASFSHSLHRQQRKVEEHVAEDNPQGQVAATAHANLTPEQKEQQQKRQFEIEEMAAKITTVPPPNFLRGPFGIAKGLFSHFHAFHRVFLEKAQADPFTQTQERANQARSLQKKEVVEFFLIAFKMASLYFFSTSTLKVKSQATIATLVAKDQMKIRTYCRLLHVSSQRKLVASSASRDMSFQCFVDKVTKEGTDVAKTAMVKTSSRLFYDTLKNSKERAQKYFWHCKQYRPKSHKWYHFFVVPVDYVESSHLDKLFSSTSKKPTFHWIPASEILKDKKLYEQLWRRLLVPELHSALNELVALKDVKHVPHVHHIHSKL